MDSNDETNFENIFANICSRLKSTGEVESTSKQFGALSTDYERYNFVEPLLNDFVPPHSLPGCAEKSEIKASSLREAGNEKFRRKLDLEALDFYTKSILFAPADSKMLALGYGNRSAVLKSLKKYHDCLADIDRALNLNFPESLAFKILIRKGECLINIGQQEEAIRTFLEAQDKIKQANLNEEKCQEQLQIIARLIVNCKGAVKNPEEPNLACAPLPAKSFDQNEEIICASSCVKIQYSDEMGRHICATRDIEPGDVIMVEQPYSWILLPEFLTTHCSFCLKRYNALVPCPVCVNVMYCGNDCLEAAAQKYHNFECKYSSAVVQLDMGKMSLLAVRILTMTDLKFLSTFLKKSHEEKLILSPDEKRTLAFNQNNQYDSLDFAPIFHLICNTEARSVSDLFKRTVMAACLLKCLELDKHKEAPLLGAFLLRLLQNLPCNAHEVSETVLPGNEKVPISLEIGAAAYACLSLLNHSCDPNVVRHSHGNTAVLRAIKFIPKGSEILDNYGYHFAVHSKEIRQSHLRSQYLFNCACPACSNSWPLHYELPNLPRSANKDIIEIASKKLETLIHESLAGKQISETDLIKIFEHLKFLEEKGARLCQEFNCCQEIVKQHFARHGNFYKI
ncbi:SET and MYND domain-containing protein 4-like [Neocloeon triangulifer]|uniref:SET and MYND domain-containing protein 4-like n=1 Tax=Neocloeon triangulifer TaxID=2078957 RepID=UPI00286F804A|nr:SET and MYND domain-containing protein 4-like [Neocloeon triangulifer]